MQGRKVFKCMYFVHTTRVVCTNFAEWSTLSRSIDSFSSFNLSFEIVQRSQKGQVLLVLLWGFAEYGNRKSLRMRAQ